MVCHFSQVAISSATRLIISQADKLRAQQQLEQLQARYVGTGHADTTRFEWTSNIQRDSYASYIGHPPMLSYMAIGLGEPREKVRAAMIEVGDRQRERERTSGELWMMRMILIVHRK
jgi:splicing factor 3B subunit 5